MVEVPAGARGGAELLRGGAVRGRIEVEIAARLTRPRINESATHAVH